MVVIDGSHVASLIPRAHAHGVKWEHALNNHFLTQHTDLNMDIDSLFDTICSCSEELFTIGLKLSKFV